MPLVDGVEWWDGPSDDDEVLIYARRINDQRAVVAPPRPTNWQRTSPLLKLLFLAAFGASLMWCAVVGLVGIICLIPPLTPLGLLLVPIAGSPTTCMIYWMRKEAGVPTSQLPPPPNS